MTTRSPHDRLDRFGPYLNTPIKVAAVWVVSLAVLVVGGVLIGTEYSATTFAADYLPVEAVLSAALIGLSLVMLNPSQIGLRRPEMYRPAWLAVGLIPVGLVLISVLLTCANLPAGADVDGSMLARTFGTTALVGFTEEWMYRGLLLVALTTLFGYRSGVIGATALFGLFHATNLFFGQSPGETAVQVVITGIAGMVFVYVALGTRSLIPAMILHALYDFAVFTNNHFDDLGASVSPLQSVGVTLLLISGVVGYIHLPRRQPEGELYPVG